MNKDVVINSGVNRVVNGRNGYLLYNKNDIYIGKSIEKYGEFSHLEAELFEQICKENDNIIEVGANIGAHTVYLSKLVKNGVVIAFEPQRVVFQNLCANVALNSLLNVHTFQQAVGDIEEDIVIPECDFTKTNNFGGINIENSLRGSVVKKIKLDSFVNKLSSLKFLKVDVEGMEIPVINGSKKLIEKFKPIIYIENDRQEHSQKLIELLWSLDYKLFWHLPRLYNKSNYFNDEENIFGNIISVNMICVHKNSKINIVNMQEVTNSSFHPLKK